MQRNFKKEYNDFHSKPEEIAKRSSRNKARRKLKNAGVNVAGKDVDHKDRNAKNNSRSNLRVLDKSTNRSRNGKKRT